MQGGANREAPLNFFPFLLLALSSAAHADGEIRGPFAGVSYGAFKYHYVYESNAPVRSRQETRQSFPLAGVGGGYLLVKNGELGFVGEGNILRFTGQHDWNYGWYFILQGGLTIGFLDHFFAYAGPNFTYLVPVKKHSGFYSGYGGQLGLGAVIAGHVFLRGGYFLTNDYLGSAISLFEEKKKEQIKGLNVTLGYLF
jgi:hypothetical protein